MFRKQQPTPNPPLKTARLTAIDYRVVILLIIAGAILRLPHIGRLGLWLDEVYVLNDALDPVSEILRKPHLLHFLAIKPFIMAAKNDVMLRMPSALTGLMAIPLAYLAGLLFTNRLTAAVWATLVTFSPFLIHYSIDANYYMHMLFWVLFALVLVGLAVRNCNPWLYLPLPLLAIADFFVHPFSSLFFASLAVFVAAELVLRNQYYQGRRLPKFVQRSLLWRALAFLAAVGGVAAVAMLFPQTMQTLRRFASMVSPGATPTNIELSEQFFFTAFRQFGPAYYDLVLAVTTVGTIVFFVVFVIGAIRSGKKSRFLPIIILLPFIISFGIIFNLDARRFFHIRYFTYLVPIYLLGVAFGVEAIVNLLPMRWKTKSAIVGCAVLIAFSFPQYVHLFTIDGHNWDAVMPNIKDSAPIVYTNWAEKTLLDYYTDKYGLKNETRQLSFYSRRSRFVESQLKDLCFRTPYLWFLSSWTNIQSPEAVGWANDRLKRQAFGRSLFAQANNVALFRWDMGGKYVLPARITTLEVDRTFQEKILFEKHGHYFLRVKTDDMLSSGSVRGSIDKKDLTFNREGSSLVAHTHVTAGLHEVEVRADGMAKLEIYHDPARIVIPSEYAYEVYPSDFVWMPKDNEGYFLALKRNTYAKYAFGIANAGRYVLSVEGCNDDPGPVLIELRIDGESRGVFGFGREDGSWEKKELTVDLEEGNHDLTVAFLNEGDVNQSESSLDRDGKIRGFEMRPSSGVVPDDRLYVPEKSYTVALTENGQLSSEIVVESASETRVAATPETLTIALPPEHSGFFMLGPPQGIDASRFVYWSAQIQAENLQNHSANLSMIYVDQSGEPITAPTPVNAQGITGSTPFVTFVDFEAAPKDAVAYVPMVWIYLNGKRTSSEEGMIHVKDWRIYRGVLRSEALEADE